MLSKKGLDRLFPITATPYSQLYRVNLNSIYKKQTLAGKTMSHSISCRLLCVQTMNIWSLSKSNHEDVRRVGLSTMSVLVYFAHTNGRSNKF